MTPVDTNGDALAHPSTRRDASAWPSPCRCLSFHCSLTHIFRHDRSHRGELLIDLIDLLIIVLLLLRLSHLGAGVGRSVARAACAGCARLAG